MMTYSESLDWLYGLASFDKNLGAEDPETARLGRIRTLLEALGHPEQRYKSIHVAGTKGKGSTCAMLDSALRQMSYKVGLFTSPHLVDFRERIRVDGHWISADDAAALANRVRSAIEAVGIERATTFEAITAMGLTHFADVGCAWAVVETGLGGRLDPTNAILPQASVITSLSIDHTAQLGNTLALIAAEKAGIIKEGVPVISHGQMLPAAQVIERVARERHAPLTVLGNHWRGIAAATESNRRPEAREAAPLPDQRRMQSFQVKQVARIRSVDKPYLSEFEGWYEIPLLGLHQMENATAVIATLDALRQRGEPFSPKAAHEGLRRVIWAARFDVLRAEPPLIADGAHNIDSVNKLAMTLAELYPGRRWTFIFGCLADKDAEGMFNALRQRAQRWIFVKPDHPRGLPAEALLAIAQKRGARATVAPSLREAIDEIVRLGESTAVTGSLTLAGQAASAFGRLA